MGIDKKKISRPIRETLDGIIKPCRFLCERCKNKYARPLEESGVCYNCDLKDRRRLILREERQASSGVSKRHIKFRNWKQLLGPDDYLKNVQKVKAFLEHGDTICGLIGARGTGKTQIGAVAVWQTIESGHPAEIISSIGLLADLKYRYDLCGNAVKDWAYDWTHQKLLVIDEITVRIDSEHDRAMLTYICNQRYEKCLKTILIGNLAPADFQSVVGVSVASRCTEGGGLIHCTWESFRKMRGKTG